jgi:hypothetical protein
VSNNPKILFELSRDDASYLMDLMHADWQKRVAEGAVASLVSGAHDAHVWAWIKRRPSRIMNYMDDAAYKQGFCEDGKGL